MHAASIVAVAVGLIVPVLTSPIDGAYILAEMQVQAKSDPEFAPGARNRYDDFVAAHINQTTTIHKTGNLLTWHRYFVWAYEEALRNVVL